MKLQSGLAQRLIILSTCSKAKRELYECQESNNRKSTNETTIEDKMDIKDFKLIENRQRPKLCYQYRKIEGNKKFEISTFNSGNSFLATIETMGLDNTYSSGFSERFRSVEESIKAFNEKAEFIDMVALKKLFEMYDGLTIGEYGWIMFNMDRLIASTRDVAIEQHKTSQLKETHEEKETKEEPEEDTPRLSISHRRRKKKNNEYLD